MPTITITSFGFSPALTATETVSVKWRLASAPDVAGSYTAAPNATVNTSGTITSPTPYTITVPVDDVVCVATNSCGEPGFAKEFYISNCCPVGDTMVGTTCSHTEEVAATDISGGTPIEVCHYANAVYSQYGTIIYSTYNTNGTYIAAPDFSLRNANAGGSSTSTVWGNPNSQDAVGSDGRMNKTAIWDCANDYRAGDLGFGFEITVPVTGTYYIGFGADNSASISIDGVVIIDQDPEVLGEQLCGAGNIDCLFKYWHIYPISLSQGTHIINVIGNNISSQGSFGCEIYNATATQLKACTTASGTYGDTNLAATNLHRYIVYSTQSIANNTTADVGNYTCPNGYNLVKVNNTYVCRDITNTPATLCSSTKVGALIEATTTSATPVLGNTYGLKLLRAPHTISGSGRPWKTFSDAGFEVIITINTTSPGAGSDLPTGAALTQYGSDLDAFFTEAVGYNYNVVCIQNEENNGSYWNDPDPNEYLAMLDLAIPKAHAAGKKVTNGGLTGDALKYMTWKDLKDNVSSAAAQTFAEKVFPPNIISNLHLWGPTWGPAQKPIAFMQVAIPGYAARDMDYVNFHWYEPNHTEILANTSIDPEAILTVVRYLERATGKKVINNEFGQHNMTDNIIPQMLDALMGDHMEYIAIYDGDAASDAGNGKAYAMHNTDNTIRTNGTATINFLKTHQ